MKPHQIQGLLRDSIALSGFLSDDSGPALCFSIVTNGNQWGARYRIRREHELMVAAMQRYLDARSDAAAPARVLVEREASRPATVERAASAPAGEPEDGDEGSGEETGDDESSEAAEAPAAAAGRPAPTPNAAPPASAAATPAATSAPIARPEREPRRPDAVAPAP